MKRETLKPSFSVVWMCGKIILDISGVNKYTSGSPQYFSKFWIHKKKFLPYMHIVSPCCSSLLSLATESFSFLLWIKHAGLQTCVHVILNQTWFHWCWEFYSFALCFLFLLGLWAKCIQIKNVCSESSDHLRLVVI